MKSHLLLILNLLEFSLMWHSRVSARDPPDLKTIDNRRSKCLWLYLFSPVCIRPIPKKRITKINENTGMKITARCLEILRCFSLFFVDFWAIYKRCTILLKLLIDIHTSMFPHLLCPSSPMLPSNFCFICREIASSLKWPLLYEP